MSPGTALLSAACRFPPAGTTRVAAEAAEAKMVKIEMTKNALVSLGKTQRIAAHNWEIRTFFLRSVNTGIGRTSNSHQSGCIYLSEGRTARTESHTT